MKETIAHILEVVVVVIALFAVIAIITMMTQTGSRDENGNLVGAGVITQQIDTTIDNVFKKTTGAIEGTTVGTSLNEDAGKLEGTNQPDENRNN